MILLALSTSGRAASAALLKDGVPLAEATRDEGLTHSETILLLAAELLDQTGLAPRDIGVFAADVGPGSFTGVRIGVCAVNAMAAACGAPVVAVSSLAALREGISEEPGPVCTLIDARNGNAYAALFDKQACLMQPAAAIVAELLPTLPRGTLFVGDGAEAYRDEILSIVPNARFAAPQQNLLTALPVAHAAWRLFSAGETVREAMPLYLRPTQAERLYKEKK